MSEVVSTCNSGKQMSSNSKLSVQNIFFLFNIFYYLQIFHDISLEGTQFALAGQTTFNPDLYGDIALFFDKLQFIYQFCIKYCIELIT